MTVSEASAKFIFLFNGGNVGVKKENISFLGWGFVECVIKYAFYLGDEWEKWKTYGSQC